MTSMEKMVIMLSQYEINDEISIFIFFCYTLEGEIFGV